MTLIEEILKKKIKPKEKQMLLAEALISGNIPAENFITYFVSASDLDKGTCADVMKHVSAENPEILIPYLEILVNHINYKAPRVKWGVPEAIGYMAKKYPFEVVAAIPFLLKNITDDKSNTTVIKWCASFALTEIAKHNPETKKQLIPVFEKILLEEKNNGIRNLYVKAMKVIEKQR